MIFPDDCVCMCVYVQKYRHTLLVSNEILKMKNIFKF